MKKKLLLLLPVLSLNLGAQNNFPTPSGNVSIGAPNAVATAKLHILETTLLPNSQNASQIITRIGGNVGFSNNLYNNTWLVRSETNAQDWWTVKVHDALSLQGGYLTPGTDTKTFWERHPFADRQTWGNDNNPYMTLLAGRLGIGIYTPAARLDIQEATNGFSTFIARNLGGGGYCILSNVNQDLTTALAVVNTSNGWAENFAVYGNGKTKIGSLTQTGTHANALLTVNGKAVAKEIIVTTANWADFVFDKSYKPMPLKELENFYTENHHLPNVPTTKEITDNGNDLGKTDAILLQKIEELTLYIVEVNKKVDRLEKENAKLLNK